jgi:hypothetical protein
MANLLDPARDYPALASLDEPIDRNFRAFEAATTPAEERGPAYAEYEQALAAKAEIIEPLWQQAVQMKMFSVSAADVPYGDGDPRAAVAGHLFRDSDEFYGAVVAVREALRTLAARRTEKLPIALPMPAAPYRVQILGRAIYHAPDFIRDLFLPALISTSIDVIQLCPNCGKLVLAARQRKHQACSPECANAERVKAFRAKPKNKDYYTADARRTRKKIAERAAKRQAKRKAQ